jgi:hypothetical protein
MGMVRIEFTGSFGKRAWHTTAMEFGHAQAIADAIEWLAKKELPKAIEQDHRLHDEGARPERSFGREET